MTAIEPRPCYICGDVFNDKLKLGMHIVRCYEAALQSGRRDLAPPDAIVDEGYTKVVMKDPKSAFLDMKAALKKNVTTANTHDTTRKRVSEEMKSELEKLRKLREEEEERIRQREEEMAQRLQGLGNNKSTPTQQTGGGGGGGIMRRHSSVEAGMKQRHVTVQSPNCGGGDSPKVDVAVPVITPAAPQPQPPGPGTPGWTEFMVTYPRPVIEEKPMSREEREKAQEKRKMKEEEMAFRRMLEEEKQQEMKKGPPSSSPPRGGGASAARDRRTSYQQPSSPSKYARPPSRDNSKAVIVPSTPPRPASRERAGGPQVVPPTLSPPKKGPPTPRLQFCTHCGRPFPPERLPLHSTICKRVVERTAAMKN
eukprot:PhF_6_TR2331/c0_g2_i1/m.4155